MSKMYWYAGRTQEYVNQLRRPQVADHPKGSFAATHKRPEAARDEAKWKRFPALKNCANSLYICGVNSVCAPTKSIT